MKYVIGNWKMNPVTVRDAEKLIDGITKKIATMDIAHTEIVVCPPMLYVNLVSEYITNTRCRLGTQDMFTIDQGAATGKISPLMIKDFGAQYVIVGHSEMRAQGETDQMIAEKIVTCMKHALIPVVCVGEHVRDDHSSSIVADQLRSALQLVPKEAIARVMVAYEPVWAIGSHAERPATAEEIYEMKLFIQKTLVDFAGDYGLQTRILYGGSVHADTAEDMLRTGNVDGFLVGGASLVPQEFCDIVKIVERNN